MSLTDPTTLGARLDALAREDDDIPDRLRTLAAEPDESPLVKAFGAWTPLAPETVPTDADHERLRAWLDRGLTPRPAGYYIPHHAAHWPARIASWRDFERDCTCNPGPVPVEGGFVWRRCSCENES